ncbi:hypothetical protein A2U01_0052202 [Trifolium medium]|uniref:Uncharacterized protein n=1 Tax=Trifolium medium TaxID=97028 RepID=A0A392R337_9FABA|nr:hypothetical protein [Trifolium medium]
MNSTTTMMLIILLVAAAATSVPEEILVRPAAVALIAGSFATAMETLCNVLETPSAPLV